MHKSQSRSGPTVLVKSNPISIFYCLLAQEPSVPAHANPLCSQHNDRQFPAFNLSLQYPSGTFSPFEVRCHNRWILASAVASFQSVTTTEVDIPCPWTFEKLHSDNQTNSGKNIQPMVFGLNWGTRRCTPDHNLLFVRQDSVHITPLLGCFVHKMEGRRPLYRVIAWKITRNNMQVMLMIFFG